MCRPRDWREERERQILGDESWQIVWKLFFEHNRRLGPGNPIFWGGFADIRRAVF